MKHRLMILLNLVVFIGMMLLFVYGFHNTDATMDEEDLNRVKQAVQKAALECYSIEGFYPEDVEYLVEHYGLYLQEDLYSIRYGYIGSNIMPDTNVFAIRKGNDHAKKTYD